MIYKAVVSRIYSGNIPSWDTVSSIMAMAPDTACMTLE